MRLWRIVVVGVLGVATVGCASDWDSLEIDPTLTRFPFDEGAGDITHARGELPTQAQVLGAMWADGRDGRALSFDGVDDAVSAPFDGGIDLGEQYSVAFWIRFEAEGVVLSCRGNPRLVIEYDNQTRLALIAYGAGTSDWPDYHVVTPIPPAERWQHVAATVAGTSIALFVDGELVAREELQQVAPASADGGCFLGWSGLDYWTERFAGQLDEFRIYRRTLSATEVSELAGR